MIKEDMRTILLINFIIDLYIDCNIYNY